jgi:hypothetical protein
LAGAPASPPPSATVSASKLSKTHTKQILTKKKLIFLKIQFASHSQVMTIGCGDFVEKLF